MPRDGLPGAIWGLESAIRWYIVTPEMADHRQEDAIQRFKERCREQGIPFTVQRRRTYEVLLARADHPTADQVYEDARAVLPGVSRMTVYRVLELLGSLGLVRKVCHPGSAVRFDPNLRRHHHLICHRCNRLIDFEEASLDELDAPPAARRAGFKVDDHVVQFRGTCSECESADKTPEEAP
ncbi:MAG: transcriptional repressor [Candidatus Eisenbacteria bacterium]|nr:transcriptional repressor [Candidatus Eisenbacteria bacterium]